MHYGEYQGSKTSKFSPQKSIISTLFILARCLMLKQQLNLWIYGVVVWMEMILQGMHSPLAIKQGYDKARFYIWHIGL
jgi:Na+/H+ antiporter NhaA